jgi:hypothetical protein
MSSSLILTKHDDTETAHPQQTGMGGFVAGRVSPLKLVYRWIAMQP